MKTGIKSTGLSPICDFKGSPQSLIVLGAVGVIYLNSALSCHNACNNAEKICEKFKKKRRLKQNSQVDV